MDKEKQPQINDEAKDNDKDILIKRLEDIKAQKLQNGDSSADDNALYNSDRLAKNIIKSFISSMPSILHGLQIKGNKQKASNEVKAPFLDKYKGIIELSYIIIKNDRNRIIHAHIYNKNLYQSLRELLSQNKKLREDLTKKTDNIHLVCPDVGKGIRFKYTRQGLFRTRTTSISEFAIT